MPVGTPPVAARRTVAGGAARVAFGMAIIGALWRFAGWAGWGSPWFAATLSICLLGLFDLVRYFTRLPVLPGTGMLRPFELRGQIYRRLGVAVFGGLLRNTPLRLLNARVYVGSGRGLAMVAEQLAQAEASHTLAFVLVSFYLVVAVAQGWTAAAVVLAAINLFVNAYPILHLRWVRARMERLRSRALERRPKTG